MNISSIQYKSTHCYFIETLNGILAFDAGWPKTYTTYKDLLRKEGLHVKDISYLLVSHFHMDHAGLAGVMVNNGVDFYILENQWTAIEEMENLILSKEQAYTTIKQELCHHLKFAASRSWLQEIGIKGEIILTNGHAFHHISLVLDSGEAFTGDLPPEGMFDPSDHKFLGNWNSIKDLGATKIFPAHGRAYELK